MLPGSMAFRGILSPPPDFARILWSLGIVFSTLFFTCFNSLALFSFLYSFCISLFFLFHFPFIRLLYSLLFLPLSFLYFFCTNYSSLLSHSSSLHFLYSSFCYSTFYSSFTFLFLSPLLPNPFLLPLTHPLLPPSFGSPTIRDNLFRWASQRHDDKLWNLNAYRRASGSEVSRPSSNTPCSGPPVSYPGG